MAGAWTPHESASQNRAFGAFMAITKRKGKRGVTLPQPTGMADTLPGVPLSKILELSMDSRVDSQC
jgi:hypothetical protein